MVQDHMTDIVIEWSAETTTADLFTEGGDLGTGDELESAVIISLFTWGRARTDDRLPDYESRRMGWWGDSFASVEGDRIGSRLWLLRREKLTRDTINRAVGYARESLQWLIDSGVASAVDVQAERRGADGLALLITITRDDRTARTLTFENIWTEWLNG